MNASDARSIMVKFSSLDDAWHHVSTVVDRLFSHLRASKITGSLDPIYIALHYREAQGLLEHVLRLARQIKRTDMVDIIEAIQSKLSEVIETTKKFLPELLSEGVWKEIDGWDDETFQLALWVFEDARIAESTEEQ